MSLPSVDVVRQRIESISSPELQLCCKAAYLWCGRISEVVSRAYGNEKAYGPKSEELNFDAYESYEVSIFDVHTAKRGGMIRKVALPLELNPWTKELSNYYQKFDAKDYVFPYTRQFVWRNIKDAFQGLTYPIEAYIVTKQGKLEKVKPHERDFRLHALRHLRATELVEHYGFDGFNLAAYGGWTIRTAQAFFGANIPGVISRYLYLNWQGYIKKLLRD